MKLISFNDLRIGVAHPEEEVAFDIGAVVDAHRMVGPEERMNVLIEDFDILKSRIEQHVATAERIPLPSLRLRAPLPRPRNVVCMAVNYMEDGTRTQPAPINAFLKPATSIIGPGDTMVLPNLPATIFEGEAELGLVIGKKASRVSQARAFDHIFGYVNFIDGSARGLPPRDNVFYQMKTCDTFAPMGPYIVTADEVADPQNLRVRLSVNGAVMQDFNTSDMAHKIQRCIEWVSAVQTLHPGDVVATGTNHRGLSALQDGDRVELEIEGLGKLAIGVTDELRRSWSRETRLQYTSRNGLDLSAHVPQSGGKYSSQDNDAKENA